jgi:CelD/BcsL family acetyltransferase involved in cellulose biosynthesis
VTALTLEPIERLSSHREEWTRLALATAHPFATWEWNECWWRILGAGRELYSFAVRDGAGDVLAILPLYVAATRPVGIARFLGYADLMSPICAPEHRAAAAEALRMVITRPHRCRALVAERMPGQGDWGELVGGRLIRRDRVPELRIDGTSWEELLATKKRKFRGNLRRAEERLLTDHGLTYRLADDPDRLVEDMQTLYRLHASRWGEETTGVFAGVLARFHTAFAAEALRQGWLRLWFAEIDGKAAAAWYGWRYAGVDWHYQSGRDPEYDRLSVGTALFVHTLREAFNDGMSAYNFLAGDEGYKLHFAGEDPGAETRVVGSGVLGKLAAAAYAAGTRVSPRTRRRLLRVARRG